MKVELYMIVVPNMIEFRADRSENKIMTSSVTVLVAKRALIVYTLQNLNLLFVFNSFSIWFGGIIRDIFVTIFPMDGKV